MGAIETVIYSRVDRQTDTTQTGAFEVSIYTRKNPHKESVNEDSVGYVKLDDDTIILIVADGVGGHPKGDDASNKVVLSVCESLKNIAEPKADSKKEPTNPQNNDNLIRNAILNGIETANQNLINDGSGAKTTVTVCEIRGNQARSYQVGDSELLICGQRGKIKYKTTSHSPVGYGVEAGLITERAALKHPDRHYILNVVGEAEMKIEMGPKVTLSPRDTILIGSDGLFDNFTHKDLSDWVRVGKLDKVLTTLEGKLDRRIKEGSDNSEKAKYDDVSFLMLRHKYQPASPKKRVSLVNE